jgi:FMN-dependent oxidoreductase (nitrilotriacetate monooxygenase family)
MARLINTLDHVTEGRIGWNCVTSSNDGAAENYGRDKHLPHDERYDVADEFADVVTRLWEAWEPDAVVLDPVRPLFADGTKVHPINHDGKYFKVRGPLNAPRSPQGRVPICQAGGSPRGQAFASRWADTIITNALSVEAMKKFREDVRRRAAGYGRDPDSIKVLYLTYPIVDASMAAALERKRRLVEEDSRHLDMNLSGLSRLTNIDFSKFDLDQPLPAGLTTNGHQSSLANWIGKTPRELATATSSRQGIELVGTPDSVAGRMQEIMQEVGGDGFLFFNTYFDRRYIMEICDGLVPELQRRGLVRKAYAHRHLRDNLLEF